MSYTAVYSPLYPTDGDDSVQWYTPGASLDSVGHGVVVTDPDGLEASIKPTIHADGDFGKRATNEYPEKVYKTLYGFKTWDMDRYNIERLGFGYSYDDAVDFWSTVSRHTEPFYFYNSGTPNTFPVVTDVVEGERTAVYRVFADAGELEIETITFEHDVMKTETRGEDA